MITTPVKVLVIMLLACAGIVSKGIAMTIESQLSNSRGRLLRLHYENATGEKGLTTFSYDEKGHLEVAIWELLDGSRNSLNFYEYDKDGNLARKYREFSDTITSEELYGYDESGNLITENFQRSDNVSGKAVHEYDADGKLLRTRCDSYKGWLNAEITYGYDSAGLKTEGIIRKDTVTIGNIAYSYNEAGDLIKEHWDFPGQWSQTFVYEWEPCGAEPPAGYTSSNVFIVNTNNYRVAKENYDWSGESGGPSHYEYDAAGKLITKTFERSDGLVTRTTFLYDCKGRLTKSYRKYHDGMSAVFTYEFNDNRRLTKRHYKRIDGESGSEIYEYDGGTRLTRADLVNFDSWLTGVITFTCADDGTLKAGQFESAEGGHKADLTFDYDETKNPTRIHWVFSFDKTQTYTFEYTKLE